MSHLVLARKWRPRSFAELVGQEHVVRALSNALEQGRLHHAYLFTGTRGVGKTTLARILAKCLNCESAAVPTPTPCGTCPACRDIEAGRFVDLIEIDAASYTGVDNMREVLENAQYAPTAGRFKVYIIDEVHMLSKSAFNAMLKTLEEPPAHVLFILATTDPQKVPVTVLSRCLQFNLKQMPPARVAEHLARVLTAEEIPFEPAAVNLLARAASGSMRDALSLTDQAIAYGAGRLQEAETRAMLGVIDHAYLYPILEALVEGNGPALLAEAENLAARSLSFEAALQDLAGLLHQISIAQTVPECVAEDLPDRERLLLLAQRLDAETVQLHYQIACLGRRDLEWAPDEFAGFSMTLLRMLAFCPVPGTPQGNPVTMAPPPARTAPALSGLSLAPPPLPASHAASPLPATDVGLIPAAASPQAGIPSATMQTDWIAITNRLSGGAKQLAAQCEFVEHRGQVLHLRIPDVQKPLLSSFGEKLKIALTEHLGPGLKVEFEFGATRGAAPAEVAARAREARQAEAEAAIYNDPFVQAVVKEFDAEVSQIQPLN